MKTERQFSPGRGFRVGRRCPHRAALGLQRPSENLESQPGPLGTDAPYPAPDGRRG